MGAYAGRKINWIREPSRNTCTARERARDLGNMLRQRADNPAGFVKRADGSAAANYVIGLYNAPWTDQNTARKAVRFERRLELCMEGYRVFDLVRWGIAESEKNWYFSIDSLKRTYMTNAKVIAGKNEYYPIPVRAIVLSSINGVEQLKQNPGY